MPSPKPPGLGSVLARNIRTMERRRDREDVTATLEVRVADAIIGFTGSMRFVYLHLVLFGLWILVNLGLVPGAPEFDPSFVILAMVASVEAIFLSTFVLISQNRMAAAADKRANLDLQINLLSEHEVTKLIALVSSIADRMGVKTEVDLEVDERKQDAAPEAVLDEIEERKRREVMSTEDHPAMPPPLPQSSRLSTGIAGLDDIMGGGLTPGRLYLVEGTPGAGKTTLGLQFLLEGRARGERGLFITLSETNEELEAVAASHGWSLDGIDFFELTSAENLSSPDREVTLLHPWEVELGETIQLITDQADRVAPTRVVFDSISEMRLLAEEPLRFRRQVLALKQFFAARKATVLLLEELILNGNGRDLPLLSLSHGVIRLERWTLDFGGARRRVEITKMRGTTSREGWHDYKICTGGIEVFPTLVAAEHVISFIGEPVPSGLTELDSLLDGGPLRGTSTLLTGPAGSGKSTLMLQYACAAAARNEHCVIYEFEERIGTLLVRAAKLGLDLQAHIKTGLVTLRQVDPAQIAPGEFAHIIRKEVEENGARLVVIDSLNGYLSSMPQEKQLVLQLHELLAYLNQQGVLTFLVNPQHGVVGSLQTSLDLSYLADTVMLLRFFEAEGRIRKALSIIKNRGGAHEDRIREYRIDTHGLRVGDPLTMFRGVLTGTPAYTGDIDPLLEERGANPT